jgi:pseudouridine kinase
MKTLVIGACNIDVLGYSGNKLIKNESNVGEVVVSLGGVAKNIAENLHNLGMNTTFLTQIGQDGFENYARQYLLEIGLDISHSFITDKSNIFLGLFTKDGEFDLGVNDLSSIEGLTPENFYDLDTYIDSYDFLVFDTNLNEKVLVYLIEKYKHKTIFVDGVSQTKVKRIKQVLACIDVIKLNYLELNALLETKTCDIIKGIKELYNSGVKNIIITSGKDSIYYNIHNEIYDIKVLEPKKIISSNGAGDALFSGVIYKYASSSFHQAIEFGKVLAAKTLEVHSACNKDISNI